MISFRTKVLLCGSALAPASIVVARMSAYEVETRSRGEGAISVTVEPGYIYYFFLLVGTVCLLAFLMSLVHDLRRTKK